MSAHAPWRPPTSLAHAPQLLFEPHPRRLPTLALSRSLPMTLVLIGDPRPSCRPSSPPEATPSTVPRWGTRSRAWFHSIPPCLSQFGLTKVWSHRFAALMRWLADLASLCALALVHSSPLTLPELVQALARRIPPPYDRDSSPELPDSTGAPRFADLPPPVPFSRPKSCQRVREPSSPVLALPATPKPPQRPSAPSPVTSPPRMEQLRSPSHKPPHAHRNCSSLIQRFGSTDIGPRLRALPLGPTRQCLRPLAMARPVSPSPLPSRWPPWPVCRCSPARPRARSCLDQILAVDQRSCGQDKPIPVCLENLLKPPRLSRYQPAVPAFCVQTLEILQRSPRPFRIAHKWA
jgi:hypothetical protein